MAAQKHREAMCGCRDQGNAYAAAHLSASAVWLNGGNLVKAANSCKKRCSMASMPVCDTLYQGDPGDQQWQDSRAEHSNSICKK